MERETNRIEMLRSVATHWKPVFRREYIILGLVLVLALVHGLIYIFLVPPWQHYDEPNHFEYAWLIANRSTLPKPGEYDQAMRRAVATSMLTHHFFDGLSYRPNLDATDEPIWIGTYGQVGKPPLYYLAVSLPLRFMRASGIDSQLYAARSISLLLFLLSILCAWGVMVELTPRAHPFRWMIPMTMALLPSYVDLMTAVNSDVGATVAFSLFLYGGVRLMRRGFSFWAFLFVAATLVLCFLVKSTAIIALPLSAICILFALRGSSRWLAWSIILIGTMAGLLATFTWQDASFWYRDTLQPIPTRMETSQAPLGHYVLQLEILPQGELTALRQFVPLTTAQSLRGKTVTLGAWMWATRPIRGQTPALDMYDGKPPVSNQIDIGTEPSFVAFTTTVAENVFREQVVLSPLTQPMMSPVTVYYDGLVLVEGARPTNEPPHFNSPGETGMWGGQPFHNLLRNASAEQVWLGVRPWVDAVFEKSMPDSGRASMILATLSDWPATGWYYAEVGKNLLRTFWAQFGWGQVRLLGTESYHVLAIVTLVGLGGALLWWWPRLMAQMRSLWYRLRKKRDGETDRVLGQPMLAFDVMLLLSVALVGVWSAAFVRGSIYLPYFSDGWIPGARYAYPAIIPTVLLLNLGWRRVLGIFAVPVAGVILWIGFLALDVLSIMTLLVFYYGH